MVLEKQREVDMSHDSLVEGLFFLMRRNDPENTMRFPKLVEILTQMRTFAPKFDNMWHKICEDFEEFAPHIQHALNSV